MRVQNVSARLMSWVTARHAAPRSTSARRSEKHSSCWSTSRNVAGSSRSSRRGRCARHAARNTRCRSPPLSVPTIRRAELEAAAAPHGVARFLAVLGGLEPSARVRIASHQNQRFGASARDRRARSAADARRAARVRRASKRRADDRQDDRALRWRRASPAMMSSSVLLPAPLRPISATNSPGATSKLTRSRTAAAPARQPTSRDAQHRLRSLELHSVKPAGHRLGDVHDARARDDERLVVRRVHVAVARRPSRASAGATDLR